jgi:hypothetical protein
VTVITGIDGERDFLVGALGLTAQQAASMSIADLRATYFQGLGVPLTPTKAQLNAILPSNTKRLAYVTDEAAGALYIDNGLWVPAGPRGELGLSILQSDYVSSATAYADTGIQVSNVVCSGRPVQMFLSVGAHVSVAGAIPFYALWDIDANSGVAFPSHVVSNSATGYNQLDSFTGRFLPSAGTHNYKIRAAIASPTNTTSGAGTLTLVAGSTLELVEV